MLKLFLLLALGKLRQYLNKAVLLFVIIFMHGIYNYIHETNHVSRVRSFAAVLYVPVMLHVMFFPR